VIDVVDFRRSLLQALIQTGADNYKENARIAGVLDDKAQKTGAIAGAFLAAGLAYVKSENFGSSSPLNRLVGSPGLVLLSLSIGLFLLATVFSLVVMWTRTIPVPMSFADVEEMTFDLLRLTDNELTTERQEDYFRDESHIWKGTLQRQVRVNTDKARSLRAAQISLALSIIVIALLLLIMMFKVMCYRLMVR
jgi:hypothetical protein